MRRLTLLVALATCAAYAAAPPDATTLARFERIEAARRLDARGDALWDAGKAREAEAAFRAALKEREALYPKSTHPKGHYEIAQSLDSVAAVLRAGGRSREALPYRRRSIEIFDALLGGADHPVLAGALNDFGNLLLAQGDFAEAERQFRRALAMLERVHGGDHRAVAAALVNVGVALDARGDSAAAVAPILRALRMEERLSGDRDDPNVAATLHNLAAIYEKCGDRNRAEPIYRRALAMRERLAAGRDDPNLVATLGNVGLSLMYRGETMAAEKMLARALAMTRRLAGGEDHPAVALAINNLAGVYDVRREPDKAEPLFREALRMRERLAGYKPDPEVANGLNNIAGVYEAAGRTAEALEAMRRAMKVYRGLHGDRDHPDIARTLSNLAHLLDATGKTAEAEDHYRRALKMRQKLFAGRDHLTVAVSMGNLASHLRANGREKEGAALLLRAMGTYDRAAASLADAEGDAAAANFATFLPTVRDAYLDATAEFGAEAYAAVWSSKANLARAAERTHLAALAATTPEAKKAWDDLAGLRRERERLLLAVADPREADAREKRLAAIEADARAGLARLRALLPAAKSFGAAPGPDALRKILPAESAFVDVIRYTRVRVTRTAAGKKDVRESPQYAAFVVTRDAVRRVELGDAGPIDRAAARWREAITLGPAGDEFEPKVAAEAYRLVWAPLVKVLPATPAAVFVSPDGELHRLPWAALRDGDGKILLERHAVAVAPHGPFLADRLADAPKRYDAATVLVFGGADYDGRPKATSLDERPRSPELSAKAAPWPALPGAAAECDRVEALAKGRTVVARRGVAADAAALAAELPRAAFAHLATHGFFADGAFRSWMRLDASLFDFGGVERVGHGARNPLVLSGLVCAGANRKDTPDRGVVTAESIVGLDLRRLNLAVLSACETGLGEVAGGEGVFGLTRAFHVAGTRNVVASLWKVPDESTAALMNLFYASLWASDGPLTPREALRRAQLAVYRNPGMVKDWAAERGKGGTLGKVVGRPKPGTKTSPSRAWAAFVLSGPGS